MRVMDYMIEGYRQGITPNPDVMCNREIKFGLFLEKALALGADYVATGHYVRLENRGPEEFSLFTAKDTKKDQSYFLWTLTQGQLKHCLFPIGDYLKPEVREIARKAGLPTAEKKDSQGICFLGDIPIADFLKQYIPEKPGALVTTSGENIGEHSGAEFYTIGQRHINADFKFPKTGTISGRKPLYVAAKDPKTNTVVLAGDEEEDALYKREIELAGLNFITNDGAFFRDGAEVFARVRYRQPVTQGFMSRFAAGNYKLIFEKAQRFVAPGQSAVFYSKEGEMLGGGVIV
jgi:tRNA-specific 2-thiouridylase